MLDKFDEFDAVVINPSASVTQLNEAIDDRINRAEATLSVLAIGFGDVPEKHNVSFEFVLWEVRNVLQEVQQLRMRVSQLNAPSKTSDMPKTPTSSTFD